MSELEEKINHFAHWVAGVFAISIAVLVGYVVDESFFAQLGPQTSSLPARALSAYNFIVSNVPMTLFIIATFIVVDIIGFLLWRRRSQPDEEGDPFQ